VKYLSITLILLTLITANTAFVLAEDTHQHQEHKIVTVTVKVVNGTASGTSVVGDKAFITIYHGDQLIETKEADVDSAGNALFSDVPGGGHYSIIPRSKHSNMMFAGPSVNLGIAEKNINASVEVYDVGKDNSVISIGTHHLIMKIVDQSLVITEFIQLVNATDKAISSADLDQDSKPKVINIKLPSGFKDLKSAQYFVENAIVVTEDGFYDTMAIPPGSFDAMFTYKIDLVGPVMDIKKDITMQTNDLMVFSQLPDGMLMGIGQSEGKFIMPDGSEANYYPSASFNTGEKLVFQIAGIETDRSAMVMMIIVTVIFVIFVLIIAKKLLSKKCACKNAA